MTISWPSTIIPNSMSDPVVINPQQESRSPYSESTQIRASASHLYEVTYTFPPLTNTQWDLVKSISHKLGRNEVLIDLYRPMEAAGTSGTILVGSGASGASLPVTAVNSAYAPKAGRFLSITTSSRSYLYSLDTDSAAGSTSRTFALTGANRYPHEVGDAVLMETAKIQGKGTISGGVCNAQSGLWEGIQLTVREMR
mgnify:CR=1 FL=1